MKRTNTPTKKVMKPSGQKSSLHKALAGLVAAGTLAWASSAMAQMASPIDLYVMQVGDGGTYGTQGGTIALVKLRTDGTFDGTEFEDIFIAPNSGPNSIVAPVQGSSGGQCLIPTGYSSETEGLIDAGSGTRPRIPAAFADSTQTQAKRRILQAGYKPHSHLSLLWKNTSIRS